MPLAARLALSVVLAVLGVVLPATAADAEGTFVGACVMGVQVTFSSPVGLVPTGGTHGISGSGSCVVNDEQASLSLSGGSFTADPVTGFGCLAGVGHGQVRVSIAVSGFPNPVVDLVIVSRGGSVSIVGYALTIRFEGVAELLQDPQAGATCLTGGSVGSTTWDGPMAFQDPDPAPVG